MPRIKPRRSSPIDSTAALELVACGVETLSIGSLRDLRDYFLAAGDQGHFYSTVMEEINQRKGRNGNPQIGI